MYRLPRRTNGYFAFMILAVMAVTGDRPRPGLPGPAPEPGIALAPRSLVATGKRLPFGQQRLSFLRGYQPLSAHVLQPART
jgi:hypothetical protein